MSFEKFIKCSQRAACLTWNQVFVYGNVEVMDLISCGPYCQEERLMLSFRTIQMFLKTATRLRKKNKSGYFSFYLDFTRRS